MHQVERPTKAANAAFLGENGAGRQDRIRPLLSLKDLESGQSAGSFLYGDLNHVGSHQRLGVVMLPTQEVCLERIQFCISDLSDNGIDVTHTDRRHQARLVREHLEYFQMMLGYDSDPAEILELLKKST